MENDFLFKLVLIGDASVGKSCILVRFADDTFTENYITTIGVDFRFKTLRVGGKSVKLQIWDTAGQERYRTITSAYYRGADGIMIAFDLGDPESFHNVHEWLKEIDKNSQNEDVVKLVLANKSDIGEERKVSQESIAEFTRQTGIPVLETSAKSGSNIEEAFKKITSELITQTSGKNSKQSASIRLFGGEPEPKKASCCEGSK